MRDGTELRDSDLEFGDNFEEERLEFLIGPVDLVDQAAPVMSAERWLRAAAAAAGSLRKK